MSLYDAGRDAAVRYPEWRIRRIPLEGAYAAVLPHRRLMLVSGLLDKAGWNCSVAHEIVHLDRGDECVRGSCSVLDVKRELAVDRAAAERLIPFERLKAALMWGREPEELAQELDVDVDTLQIRVDMLEPEQRAVLEAQARAHDEGAA